MGETPRDPKVTVRADTYPHVPVPPERAVKLAQRNRTVVAVSALATVLLLAAGVAFLASYFRLRTALGETETANRTLETKNAELERANREIRTEKEQKERTLAVALVALDGAFFEVANQLRDVPGTELIRLGLLRRARRTLDGLNEFLVDDPKIMNYRMEGYDKLGTLESGMGASAAAEDAFTKSRDVAARLAARFPDEPLYAQNRAIATTKIAELYVRRGDFKTADALVDTIVPVATELLSARPNDIRALELESLLRLCLYERAVRSEEWVKIEPLMRERCTLYRRLAQVDRGNMVRLHHVIDGDRELAELLLKVNKTDEAGKILLRAKDAADALPDPESPPVRRLRAGLAFSLGGYYDGQKLFPKAVEAYTTALNEYEWLARRFASMPMYRYQQASVLYYLGVAAGQLGNVTAAEKHLETAEQLLAELTLSDKTNVRYRKMYDTVANLLNKIRKPIKAPDKKP
jgi:tetratricopeptide (TPR) repeat protein